MRKHVLDRAIGVSFVYSTVYDRINIDAIFPSLHLLKTILPAVIFGVLIWYVIIQILNITILNGDLYELFLCCLI